MMRHFKLKHIINKAIKKTEREFSKKSPKICISYFYGAFDISPQNIVVWYLFETDEDLGIARSTGLCSEITETTIRNLILSGYPSSAFECREKSFVSFTSQEDIDKKTDGDIHLYFQ